MYVCTYVQVHTPYMRRETKKEVLLYPAHFGSILCTACRLMRKLYDYILQAAHWSLRFLDYVCIVLYGGTRNGYKPNPPTYFTRKGYKWPLAETPCDDAMYICKEREKRKKRKEVKGTIQS